MLAVMFFLDFLVMGFVVVGVSSLEMPPDCGCLMKTIGQAKDLRHCGDDMHCACGSGGLGSGAKKCADKCEAESASLSITNWISSVCSGISEIGEAEPTKMIVPRDSPDIIGATFSSSGEDIEERPGGLGGAPDTVMSTFTIATTILTMKWFSQNPTTAFITILPSGTPYSESESHPVSDEAKIGIGVGVALAGACGIIICFAMYRFRMRKRNASKDDNQTHMEENNWESNGIFLKSEANFTHEIDGAEVRGWELDGNKEKSETIPQELE